MSQCNTGVNHLTGRTNALGLTLNNHNDTQTRNLNASWLRPVSAKA